MSRLTIIFGASAIAAMILLLVGLLLMTVSESVTNGRAARGSAYAVSTVLAGGSSGANVAALETRVAEVPEFTQPFNWYIGKTALASGVCSNLNQAALDSMFVGDGLRYANWDVAGAIRSEVLTDQKGRLSYCYGLAIPDDVELPDDVKAYGRPGSGVATVSGLFAIESNLTVELGNPAVTYGVLLSAGSGVSNRPLDGRRVILHYYY